MVPVAAPAAGIQAGWMAVLHRVRAEYMEMPGLCLTAVQAARLLGLELHECVRVLTTLVAEGELRHTRKGYIRASAS